MPYTRQDFIKEVITEFSDEHGLSDLLIWKFIAHYLEDEALVSDQQWFEHQAANGLQFTNDIARAKVIVFDCFKEMKNRELLSEETPDTEEGVREVIERVAGKERKCPYPFHFC